MAGGRLTSDLVSLGIMDVASVSKPTRPKYISRIMMILPVVERCGVTSTVRPTVLRAEMDSNSKTPVDIRSVNVSKKVATSISPT